MVANRPRKRSTAFVAPLARVQPLLANHDGVRIAVADGQQCDGRDVAADDDAIKDFLVHPFFRTTEAVSRLFRCSATGTLNMGLVECCHYS
jgi:hypothetical protein